ncbi:glyoxalase [Pacificimonas flava]|uniref:Glyoxalase n=2 Tax=Pacificimonas TaxID=1960290 RepID=A0A219B1S5_9SPHN|nr:MULTISPECIES: VOC family protein [Pacificimonas]MBZ6378220.1 VOC family protein [Pacificimonas aurantium]OWV32154.1 glyoxalase [Pacificimonas flava]
MPVEGLGGLFFRAKDPEALQAWYGEHLGMGGGFGPAGERHGNEYVWNTLAGPMVFQPFKADSDYFDADRQFMINLRVSDLDSLLEQFNAAGIEVLTDPEWDAPGVGRFARIHDPEGNAIELWEPDPSASFE